MNNKCKRSFIDDCNELNIVIHNLLERGINRYRIFELTNALANNKSIEDALKIADIPLEKYKGADDNELHK